MVAPRHDRVANPRAPTPEFVAIFPPFFRALRVFSACISEQTVSNHRVHFTGRTTYHLSGTSHGGLRTMAKATKKPPTKTQILGSIADATGLAKKDVAAVFAALEKNVKESI